MSDFVMNSDKPVHNKGNIGIVNTGARFMVAAPEKIIPESEVKDETKPTIVGEGVDKFKALRDSLVEIE